MMALNRYYYPKKSNSHKDFLTLGINCIFISHQNKDKDSAKVIANYFIKSGLSVYFDEYDSDLKINYQNNNPQKVTEAICNGINNSSHMIVLVSPNTLSSSWVPFEIGYGFEKTKLYVLCLKNIPKGSIPEYIRTAELIRDIYDLNNFISKLTSVSVENLIKNQLIIEGKSASDSLNNYMDKIIYDKY